MAAVIIAENQTAGAIVLDQLAVTVPASPGATTLTDFNRVYEIQGDPELEARILAGDILLNDGSGTLTQAESLNLIEEFSQFSAGAEQIEDEFTATAGQTVFALSKVPRDLETVTLEVNGVRYDRTPTNNDYSVSGSTLTWNNAAFTMDAGDVLRVRYV